MKFWKMSGAGNDFVLVEDNGYTSEKLGVMAVKLCRRRFSVGADGLLAVCRVPGGGIRMRYFNPDGTEAFCGNGSRCSVWWAYIHGYCGKETFLEAMPGRLKAYITADNIVKMAMPAVKTPEEYNVRLLSGKQQHVFFLDTGVPHCVVPVAADSLPSLNVESEGRALRHNRLFPEGANVDFIAEEKLPDGSRIVNVRTYERGVEAETFACGTGITASAVVAGIVYDAPSPVPLLCRGGENFKIWFDKSGSGAVNVFMQGPAEIVFEGEINV